MIRRDSLRPAPWSARSTANNSVATLSSLRALARSAMEDRRPVSCSIEEAIDDSSAISVCMGRFCRTGVPCRLGSGAETGLGYASATMLRVLDLRGHAPGQMPLLPRPDLGGGDAVASVREIIAAVRAGGDGVVRAFTSRFDQAEIGELRVPLAEADAARSRLDPVFLEALTEAGERIEAFHRRRPAPLAPFERGGVRVELLELPVERAAAYVPGGRARYPSSVLMTAIPAKVAGVSEVVLCVPPGRDGRISDEVLAAAAVAGVDEIYRIGGAQAIAAVAYGTESIRAVDVIVGAGSRWVSIAKQEVRGAVGVPAAFAGPSEVVVVADETVPPECAAIDLVVQAEHGPDGLAWLVTWSPSALEAINAAVGRFVERRPPPGGDRFHARPRWLRRPRGRERRGARGGEPGRT